MADLATVSRDSVTNEIVPNPFANTIQNSQTIAYNANLTFTTLYNKVPFLKKINQGAQRPAARPTAETENQEPDRQPEQGSEGQSAGRKVTA